MAQYQIRKGIEQMGDTSSISTGKKQMCDTSEGRGPDVRCKFWERCKCMIVYEIPREARRCGVHYEIQGGGKMCDA